MIIKVTTATPAKVVVSGALLGAKGAPGTAGTNGSNGTDGANGHGVPVAGSTGQSLVKTSGGDFATQWADRYAKPGDGIPESDLTAGIQAKLADIIARSQAQYKTTKTVGAANADYITTGASSGTTDDSQIQAACAAVIAAGGGTVDILPGTYYITQRIVVLGSNLVIRGAGQGATTLFLNNEVNQEVFVIGNGNVGGAGDGPTVIPCNDVWVQDMTIDGNKTHQTATSLYGGGATRNVVRFRSDAQTSYGGGCIRVHVKNGKQNGLSCESHAMGGFYYCFVEKCDQNGIWAENGSQWDISHNYTRNNGEDLSAGGSGIRLLSFGGAMITANQSKGDFGGGISLISVGSSSIIGNSVYRAGWEGLTTNPATGIYALGDNLTITGNAIFGSYGHGMSLNDLQHSIIANNTFRRNGQQTTNTYDDIYITFVGAASIHDNVFMGNTFENDTATFYTNKARYNINSNSPTAHDRNTFIGNRFGSPATATVANMFSGNYWGEGHLGVNPVGPYNYGYFDTPTKTIDPRNGSLIQGTGYNSSVTVTIADGIMIGQQFLFQYSQDTGNKQLLWAANVTWPGGRAPIFSGKANTSDLITFTWDGTNWNGNYSLTANRYHNYGYLDPTPFTLDPNAYDVVYGTGYNTNTTVNISAGKTDGQRFTFIFAQDVGNKVITWGANIQWSSGRPPVFSGNANTVDVINFTWDGANWNGSYSITSNRYHSYGYLDPTPFTLESNLYDVVYGTGYNSTTTVNITAGKSSGQQFTFVFAQDVGNKLITWGANIVWPGGTAPTLSTAAGTMDIFRFTWDGTNWNGSVAANFAKLYSVGGTDVAVADGGTGASTAAGARTNLGLGTAAVVDLDTDGTLAANSDTKIPSQKAVKTYADGLIAANDAMVFKGVIDCSTNPNYPAADRGHTYRVSVAGKIGGASGTNVEVGDILLCLTDGTAAGNQATVGANWSVIQANIDGALTTASIGSSVQAYDADLATIAGLTATTDNFMVAVSSAWASRTPAQVRTTLALVVGTNVQAWSAALDTLAANISANGQSLVAANYAGMKTLLGLVIGTNVQAWSAALDTWAGKTAPSGTVVGTSDTQALTAKDVKSVTNTFANVVTEASSATPTPTGDSRENELYETALAANATVAAPTGTPTNGNKLVMRLKDDGTPRTLAFNAIYRFSSDLAAPSTTVLSKTLYLGFKYNSTDSKWDCLAVLNNL